MPDPDPGSPAARAESALRRLSASRERLALAWRPGMAARAEADAGRAPSAGAWWRLLRRRLAGLPGAAQVVGALSLAWQQHPLRPGAEILASEVRGLIAPAVRRHPLAAVGAAAVVSGAAVAALLALRPWRWPLLAATFRPLPTLGRRWVRTQLAQLPLSAMVAGWLMSSSTGAARARPAAPPNDATSH